MNRKRIILLSIIAILVVLIAVEYTVKANRGKPEIVSYKGTADEITVSDGGTTYRLTSTDGKWQIGVSGTAYPADSALVEGMEKELRELRLVNRVSNRQFVDQYGLSESEAIHVVASEGGKILRELRIGKESPTGRQSYVMIEGQKGIYLTYGDLRGLFGRELDDIREKKIFSIDAGTIERLVIGFGDVYTLYNDPQASVWKAAGMEETELDQEKVKAFVQKCSSLTAKSFPLDAVPSGTPECTVAIDAGGKRITLSIYPKVDNTYLCVCSESPYAFTLLPYNAEKFMKALDSFVKNR